MSRNKKSIHIDFPYGVNDIIKIGDIYNVINYIQMTRQPCSFVADRMDALTMENLFKDVYIKFEKESHELGVKYMLFPAPIVEPEEEMIIYDDDFPDELIEPGQCF